MATVVSVMDRLSFGANTDVIVVADPDQRSLLWVPRDLWSDTIGDRINRAFALGLHRMLLDCLAEHGLAAEHSVCLQPGAIAAAVEGLEMSVPVRERLEFWYPLDPLRPIEEGRKRIAFEPPVERLAGERIHQWLGARYRTRGPGSDLERIERQQVVVALLLAGGQLDFRLLLRPGLPVSVSDDGAIEELSRVSSDWRFETLAGLAPVEIDGKMVLRSRQ